MTKSTALPLNLHREFFAQIIAGTKWIEDRTFVRGSNPLKDAHAALDTAVLTAYGFSAKKGLLSLNQQVAAKIEKGEAVMPPGVPKNYPDAKKLVTEDCIKPAGH